MGAEKGEGQREIRKAGRERDVGKVLSKSKKYIYLRIDGENLPWSEDDRIVPYLTWTIELNLIPGLGSLKRLCCVWLPNAPVPVSPSVTADTSWEASGRDPVCLLVARGIIQHFRECWTNDMKLPLQCKRRVKYLCLLDLYTYNPR